MSPRCTDPDASRPDPYIQRVAAGQHQLLRTEQLLEAGLGPRGIRHRAGAGRLHRIHQDVFALHPPPYSRTQHYLAATMTYGSGTLLSHGAAGVHQDICEEPRSFPVHVVTARPNPRSRDGIVVHRRASVDPRDVRRVDGVPCVSADLVLVQLAPSLTEGELEVVLVAAESKRFLKRTRLAELVAENRGRPGIHKLASLLELEPVIAKSDLELLFLPLWRAAGVERPLVNHPIAVPGREKPLVVDFAWPDIRMVVEADSQRFHGDWRRAADDRERDQLVSLAVWRPHRFVRRQVVSDLEGSARRLRDLTDARLAELRGSRAR